VTSPVPDDVVFYPTLDRTALVPTRGFGLAIGGHVYVVDVGPSRLGLGVDWTAVRATTTPVATAASPGTGSGGTGTTQPTATGQSLQIDMRTIAPQVSFNFGTANGWSYVSAGAGVTSVITESAGISPGRRDNGRVRALHFGGGARWFMKSHLAFTFDVRLQRVSGGTQGPLETTGTPATGTPGTPSIVAPAQTPGMMMFVVGAGLSFR
jgi:hypothetical protein